MRSILETSAMTLPFTTLELFSAVPLELYFGITRGTKRSACHFQVEMKRGKVVTAGEPDLSEGLEPAQSLLPLLIHPLLPLLLLLFSSLTFLSEATGGDGERDT